MVLVVPGGCVLFSGGCVLLMRLSKMSPSSWGSDVLYDMMCLAFDGGSIEIGSASLWRSLSHL